MKVPLPGALRAEYSVCRYPMHAFRLGPLAVLTALALSAAAPGGAQHKSAAPTSGVRVSIPPIPAELAQRTARLRAILQPSAAAWMAQQAKIERERPAPDINALQAAIQARFAGSLQEPAPNAPNLQGGDVAAAVVIVMLEMVQDGDSDLQVQMEQAQAQVQAKQALRALLNSLDQAMATLHGKSNANAVCNSSPCRSLLSQLAAVNAAGGNLAQPIRILPPRNLSYAQFTTLQAQANQALDGVNETSDATTRQIQLLVDTRTKLLQIASNIEKTNSDTQMAIVANLK
jgi:hypothetical protein